MRFGNSESEDRIRKWGGCKGNMEMIYGNVWFGISLLYTLYNRAIF